MSEQKEGIKVVKDATDGVRELISTSLTELIDENVSALAAELRQAADGKLAVSFGIKLTIIKSRIYVSSDAKWARKFVDSTEGMVELQDPNQITFGMEVPRE